LLESWQKVFLGLCLGIVVGLVFDEKAAALEPLGIIFLNLIKMITIPLIFFTLVYGITNIEAGGNLRRIVTKAIVAFILTAMLAVLIGLTTANLIRPGEGSVLELLQHVPLSEMGQPEVGLGKQLVDQVVGMIPTNAVAAMAEGKILQVILFAFFTGAALQMMRKQCCHVFQLCREMAQLSFKMIEMIMKLAPLGVFGYMAAMVGTQGIDVLWTLGKLIFTIVLACFIQYLVFGLLLRIFGGISPLPFFRKMIEPQLLAFSTSSSKATLVTLMRVSEERLGVSVQNSRFLLPLSAALNMDGGAIYQGVCVVFFAQLFGVTLTPEHYLTLLFTCTIASIGGAGIPGGVLLFLGMVLSSVGLPTEAMLLVASVDRVLDMVTTTINVTGDACVTVLVDRSEKTLDTKTYYG
jgi:Na+/H+-dicarboxylate symporter